MSCARLRFHVSVQSHNQGSEISLRSLRGHLLHTVTFLDFFFFFFTKISLFPIGSKLVLSVTLTLLKKLRKLFGNSVSLSIESK